VAAAAERVAGRAAGAAAAGALFEWVRDEIAYDMAPDVSDRSAWVAADTLDRGYGFCQQKALLLAALLRARGIPAGICVVDLYDHKIPDRYLAFLGDRRLPFHGLAVAHLGGAWRRLDPTLPRALCERKGYRLVEFRPDGDCELPRTDLAGEPHFDVLAEIGTWSDIPEEVIAGTLAVDYLHDERYRAHVHRHGPPA
jgi:transglutaminase-like putative cysteine protease